MNIIGKQPTYQTLAARVNVLLAPSLAEDWPELLATRAEGSYLYSVDGKRYDEHKIVNGFPLSAKALLR